MLINELSNLAMEGRITGRGLGSSMKNRLEGLAAMNRARSGKGVKKRRSPRKKKVLGTISHMGRGRKKKSRPRRGKKKRSRK